MSTPTPDPRDLCIAEVQRVRALGGHITQAEIDGALALLAAAPPDEPEPEPVPVPQPVPQAFPGPDDTGVPDGVELTPSGSLTVTEDGTVIDGLHIRGSVKIDADNVTIRRTLIDSGARYPVQLIGQATGLLVEDSEIDGNGVAGVAVLKEHYTLRRVDIHDVQDGPRIEGDDVTIEDSWIHDLTRVEGGHHDAIQIRKGRDIRILDNTLQARVGDDPMNAAIQIGSALGDVPITGLLVEGNYLDGGNYTINGGSSWVAQAVYRDNTFGRGHRYGVKTAVGGGSVWEDSNRYEDGTPAG